MDRFNAHLDRAWDLVSKGDTTKALVSAQRALEIDTESPEVHNLIGYIRAMDGELEEALQSYRHAMVLDDEYIDPVLNTAELLVHPDADPKEAIRLIRNVSGAIEGPEVVEAILLEVDALLNLGSIDEARQRLADIEGPETLPVCYAVFIGRALYETGDSKGAKVFLEKASTQEPLNPDAWYYLGLIARDEGLRVDAVKYFTKTLDADESIPVPPWAKHMEPAESLVKRAIAELEEKDRATLNGTELVVVTAPTKTQVQDEIDPRQVVFIEGIDPARGIFNRLWIFVRNISRAGVLPENAVQELARMIHNEINPPSTNV